MRRLASAMANFTPVVDLNRTRGFYNICYVSATVNLFMTAGKTKEQKRRETGSSMIHKKKLEIKGNTLRVITFIISISFLWFTLYLLIFQNSAFALRK